MGSDGRPVELRIRHEADGTPYVRPYLGTSPVTGRPVRPYKSFPGKTDEEALVLARDWYMDISPADVGGAALLGDMLHRHLRSLEAGGAAPNTLAAYRTYAGYVRPLWQLPVRSVEPRMIDELYRTLTTEGPRGGSGPLSTNTVIGLHWFLSGAWRHFVNLGIAETNPVSVAAKPSPKRHEAVALDQAGMRDVAARLAVDAFDDGAPARHRACAFAAWLALNTGLRCGECCGLARRDAQLFRSSLHVGATVVKVRGVAVRQERTKGGRDRNVSLAPEVADGVRRHLEWSETVAPALGPRSPLVTWDGRWELPDAVSAEFTSLCRELGVGPGVTFHSLRHTHATWLLLSGVDPKVVSERLGHADVSTTLRIYGHVLPGRDEAAARAFQAMVENEVDGSGD